VKQMLQFRQIRHAAADVFVNEERISHAEVLCCGPASTASVPWLPSTTPLLIASRTRPESRRGQERAKRHRFRLFWRERDRTARPVNGKFAHGPRMHLHEPLQELDHSFFRSAASP
jgi:hypothetical protein